MVWDRGVGADSVTREMKFVGAFGGVKVAPPFQDRTSASLKLTRLTQHSDQPSFSKNTLRYY